MSNDIGLGDRVEDTVTGYKGIVICVSTWLHGCIRMSVQPEKLKDGAPMEPQHFDQTQLKLLKKGVHVPQVTEVAPVQPTAPARRSAGGPARETAGFRR